MSQTADRYSKALFDLAKEQNSLEAVQLSMTELRELIHNLPELRQFMSNPLLTFEDRCVVLKALFEGKVPELLFKFLTFITYKSRLDILADIVESFDGLYLLSTGQLRAYVTAAFPLEKEERVIINQRLHDKFQRNVLTRWRTDASLIGGFRIYAQGNIYDYSFKSQLNHFYQQTTQPV